jgi:hypothetical protein
MFFLPLRPLLSHRQTLRAPIQFATPRSLWKPRLSPKCIPCMGYTFPFPLITFTISGLKDKQIPNQHKQLSTMMERKKRWPIILCLALALSAGYVLWSTDNAGRVVLPVEEAFSMDETFSTGKHHNDEEPPPAQCLCPSRSKLKDFGPRKWVQRMGEATKKPGCILLLHRIAVSRVDTYHYRLWAETPAEYRQVSKVAASCPVVLLTECVWCHEQFRRLKFDVKQRLGDSPKVGGVSDTAVLVLHRVWEQGPYHGIVDPGLIPMYVMAETVAENVAFWFGIGSEHLHATNLSSAFGPIPVNYTGEYYLHRVAQPGKWRMIAAESF